LHTSFAKHNWQAKKIIGIKQKAETSLISAFAFILVYEPSSDVEL